MREPYLTLTVTQRIRGLLADSGMAAAPWAPVSQVLDQLRTLLLDRRDDDVFWGRLVWLLEELGSELAQGHLPTPEAEVLASTEIDLLVDALRDALRERAPIQTTSAFLTNLTRSSLCVFLLLGMACGCDRPKPAAVPPASSQTATPVEPSAPDTGTPLALAQASDEAPAESEMAADAPTAPVDEATANTGTAEESPYALDAAAAQPKGLAEYVDESDLSDETAAALLRCVNKVDAQDRLDLLEVFQSKTPEEIAAYLEDYVTSEICTPPTQRRRRPPKLVEPVPMYKGVSFSRPT